MNYLPPTFHLPFLASQVSSFEVTSIPSTFVDIRLQLVMAFQSEVELILELQSKMMKNPSQLDDIRHCGTRFSIGIVPLRVRC